MNTLPLTECDHSPLKAILPSWLHPRGGYATPKVWWCATCGVWSLTLEGASLPNAYTGFGGFGGGVTAAGEELTRLGYDKPANLV